MLENEEAMVILNNLKTDATPEAVFVVLRNSPCCTRGNVTKKATQLLQLKKKTEKELLKIINEIYDTEAEILETILPLLKLKEKKPDKILKMSKKVSAHQTRFFEEALRALKFNEIEDWKEILKILKAFRYEREACGFLLPHLKLEKRSEAELVTILKKSNCNSTICRAVIPLLDLVGKTEDEIFALIKKLGWNTNFAVYALKTMEERI